MEVTRKNFNETLPLVAESIKKADFLAIDAEFTGLLKGRDVSIFDSPQEYYACVLNGSSEFLLIQFGLCAFYWDDQKKHYLNDAYNFYLFPRGRPGPEKMFLCQSSSLDFLAAQGFDFNKLIREGISYMTEPAETRLRELLSERQKLYTNDKEIIIIPEENKQQIQEICNKVRQFLNENKSDEMEIDRCNAWIRRLLFQEIGMRFKNEAIVESKLLDNKTRILKVTRLKPTGEGKDRDTLKKEKEWEEFEDAVGFSKVARMISQSGKLVIGHNMLLDVLHTLNHFFQPLPTDYFLFKEFAHCMFPRILDTKYMSSLPPFKDKVSSSVLQHLVLTLGEPPFSLPKAESKEGRGYSKADDKDHEAGYDAFVTGLCFLSMHAHLSQMRGEPLGRVAHDSALLKPFINKLFLARTAYQDSPYMNLTGVDPSPSREHVFHLTFPQEWQRNDLNQLFSAFGPITMQFLEDTSALVALSRREHTRDVIRTLGSHPRVSVLPYARYKQQGKAPLKEPDDRRRDVACAPVHEIATGHKRVTPPSGPPAQQMLQMPPMPQMPPMVMQRVRTSSLTLTQPPPPLHNARKRTSSGVFQVDEAEPPPKKDELVRSNFDSPRKKSEALSNGRRKATVFEKNKNKTKEAKEKSIEKEIGVRDKCEIVNETKCVSAFKESESWD